MRPPFPTSVMTVGDSWLDWGVFSMDLAFARNTSIPFQKFAFSGATVADETTGGGPGNALRNTIDASLAASPNTDFVWWGTGGLNDVLRRKQGLNTMDSTTLLAASAYILDAIKAAKKTAIVMAVPWVQILVNGISTGDATTSQAAYTLRTDYNNGLRAQCNARGHIYYELAYSWNDLGPLNNVPENGLLPEYRTYFTETTWDPTHYGANGGEAFAQNFTGCLRASPRRKAAA